MSETVAPRRLPLDLKGANRLRHLSTLYGEVELAFVVLERPQTSAMITPYAEAVRADCLRVGLRPADSCTEESFSVLHDLIMRAHVKIGKCGEAEKSRYLREFSVTGPR